MEPDELDRTLASSKELRTVLADLETRSRSFGAAITNALEGAVLDGDSLSQVLQSIASRFSQIALDSGLAPLQNALTSSFSGLTNSLISAGGGGTGSATAAPTASVASSASPQVVFNVQTTDAESFRRSESQINAMLTRAVGRGRRSV